MPVVGIPVGLLNERIDAELAKLQAVWEEDLPALEQMLRESAEDLPIVIEIADRTDKIEAFLPTVDRMVTEGLVTLEKVRVLPLDHHVLGGAGEGHRHGGIADPMLQIGRGRSVHHPAQTTDDEHRDEAERVQHRRREGQLASPGGPDPVEDLHPRRHRDDHRGYSEAGLGDEWGDVGIKIEGRCAEGCLGFGQGKVESAVRVDAVVPAGARVDRRRVARPARRRAQAIGTTRRRCSRAAR